MLSSGWDFAVLSKEGPFLSLCTYLLIKTFQMSGDLTELSIWMCLSSCVCILERVCMCVSKSNNKSALKVLVLSSDLTDAYTLEL